MNVRVLSTFNCMQSDKQLSVIVITRKNNTIIWDSGVHKGCLSYSLVTKNKAPFLCHSCGCFLFDMKEREQWYSWKKDYYCSKCFEHVTVK